MSLASNCHILGRSAEDSIEDAREKLQRALSDLAASDLEEDRLSAIGRRISYRASELVDEHIAFMTGFERMSSKWETRSSDLEQLVRTFGVRRNRVRSEMLQSQEALRVELNDEEWAHVLEALNSDAQQLAATQSFKG